MNKLNNPIDKVFSADYAIVFLHAHPDDESFLSAGLLNELVKRKKKCTVIFCAAGIVPGQRKTIIRQKEAIKACGILGIKSVLFLDFCEPKYSGSRALPLTKQKVKDVAESILNMLRKNNIQPPFILVSYDKNGGYGNIDHKIINAVGRYIQRKHKKLVPLFEITINRNKILKWIKYEKNKLAPKSFPKLSYWSSNPGLPQKEITYYYQLSGNQLKLKFKALSVYKSQISKNEFPLSLLKNDFDELFGCEFLKIQ